MRTGLLVAAVASALVLAHGKPAFAQQAEYKTHRVEPGDTLELLAAEHYGSRKFVVLIMQVNGIEHTRKLKRREKLKLPIPHPITAAVGDTLEGLAESQLGDVRRAPFLASFNGVPPNTSIAAGMTLFVPYHMTHTAASKVRLSDLAATFLFDRKQGDLIREYNFLDKNALEPGETVIIPLHVLRMKPEQLPAPDVESAARKAKRIEMQRVAAQVLPRAQSLWSSGEYGEVKGELAQIETAYLDAEDAVAVSVLLGAAYVAFGDNDSALAHFQLARQRNPTHALSPYEYSPKIRTVWIRAGGTVSEK